MNIHEYQAKSILKKYNIPVSNGVIIHEKDNPLDIFKNSPDNSWVVKAQIHAGGRGKGKFKENEAGSLGGVRFAKNNNQALNEAKKMLGNTLVTKQTGKAGKKVSTVYLERASQIKKEFYLAFLIDREKSCLSIICSNIN